MIFNGEIIDKEGYRFKVFLQDDTDNGEPWNNCDGHGPVTDWERRDKRPGEWVLNSDHGSKRFYDAQEANKIAKRDGWGLNDEAMAELKKRINAPKVKSARQRVENGLRVTDVEMEEPEQREPTKGEIRAEAVRRDFEFLYSWCNDQWDYIGVCVMCLGKVEDDPDTRVELDHSESKDLWSIESCSDDYIEEVAHEHINEFLSELAAERAADAREAEEAMYWAQRDSMTGSIHFYVR